MPSAPLAFATTYTPNNEWNISLELSSQNIFLNRSLELKGEPPRRGFRERYRQGPADVVWKSRSKNHETWGLPLSRALAANSNLKFLGSLVVIRLAFEEGRRFSRGG